MPDIKEFLSNIGQTNPDFMYDFVDGLYKNKTGSDILRNRIYRGKKLDILPDSNSIKDGIFENLFLGDYFYLDNRYYRCYISDFNFLDPNIVGKNNIAIVFKYTQNIPHSSVSDMGLDIFDYSNSFIRTNMEMFLPDLERALEPLNLEVIKFEDSFYGNWKFSAIECLTLENIFGNSPYSEYDGSFTGERQLSVFKVNSNFLGVLTSMYNGRIWTRNKDINDVNNGIMIKYIDDWNPYFIPQRVPAKTEIDSLYGIFFIS